MNNIHIQLDNEQLTIPSEHIEAVLMEHIQKILTIDKNASEESKQATRIIKGALKLVFMSMGDKLLLMMQGADAKKPAKGVEPTEYYITAIVHYLIASLSKNGIALESTETTDGYRQIIKATAISLPN